MYKAVQEAKAEDEGLTNFYPNRHEKDKMQWNQHPPHSSMQNRYHNMVEDHF